MFLFFRECFPGYHERMMTKKPLNENKATQTEKCMQRGEKRPAPRDATEREANTKKMKGIFTINTNGTG